MKPNTAYVDLEGTVEAKEGDKIALFTSPIGTPSSFNKNVEGRPVLKRYKMALDKSVVKRIADQTWKRGDVVNLESMLKFAQAIYALGVADERSRDKNLKDKYDH